MASWRINRRTSCRICGSAAPRPFLQFARMPFTDEFIPAERRGQEFTADLDVYFCPTCATCQTLHDVESGEYYRDYGYTVSASPLAQRFMDRLAAAAFDRFGLRPGDRVLEIGSGDGAQLRCFQERGARVLGFEPSQALTAASRAAGVEVVQGLFDTQTVARIPADLRPAQAVLLTYTFDHLPEPRAFLASVRGVLDPQRGVLLIEVHDLEKIVARRETCLFEHEHTVYLQRESMRRLLETAGFSLLTCELVAEGERRANSLLVAAALRGAGHAPDASADSADRERMAEWSFYAGFAAEVDRAYGRLRAWVAAQRAAGRRVAGYGAGGRGVMTLAQAGFGPAEIAYLCDRNPAGHGLYTPATHIPVVAPERLREDPVDAVIVFSYGYLAEIRAALADVEARGTRFISLLDLLRDRK